MQAYNENDTVQNLYDEIEHLIDIPFDKYAPPQLATPSAYETKDFHYKKYHRHDEDNYEEDEMNNNTQQEQQEQSNDYSFERPILIESDSDDIEEELLTPNQLQYELPVCFKCDRPIQSSNTLKANNICDACSSTNKKKSRSRSGSFNFSQLTDKLKQSFGHSSSQQLLTPAQSVDRRKSMPTMNSVFNQHDQTLAPPSPVPSRPSSRASSFIEDVKQFLAPLSRKSSRNSMHSEYLQSPLVSPQPEGPKRKSSHQSLLDVINICKPSKPKQTPSYERRVIQQQEENSHCWTQEDEEVMGIHQQSNSYFTQEHHHENNIDNSPVHIPLRRKQIKNIESRQDRIDIYNNAFFDCMRVETNLVPWIIKQTQKGPPDAWFGYTPPERSPKKIMGIFKRKSKADTGTSLRVQQQQLGDELLNRSTPLLQHRYSNSNLSMSPSNHSYNYSPDDNQQEFVSSPGGYDDDEEEEGEKYFEQEEEDERYMSPPVDPHYSILSPNSSRGTPSNVNETRSPSTIQPVSILKKTSSNVSMQRDYYQHEEEENVLEYDDHNDEDYYQEQQHHYLPRQQQRRPSYNNDYYHQQQQDMMMMSRERSNNPRYSTNVSPRVQPMYMMEPPPPINTARRRRSNNHLAYQHEQDDYYDDYRHPTSNGRSSRQQYEEPISAGTYYNDSIAMKKTTKRNNSYQRSPSYYQQDEYDDMEPEEHIKRPNSKSHNQDYYGLSVKMTPYMMEEWEIALDDLCELYPRLDRNYINDFLRSAQGDYVTAKDMIMEMIMEIR